MTVRIGIIGAGGIARHHIRSYLATPGAQVTAVCDVVPERAATLAAEFGIAGVDTNAEALLARPEVDAVSVCTPNDSHAPTSLAALRAGKHVLCEKPLAMTTAEAREMLEVAERAGLHHMVNFSKRPFPGIVQLKAMLEAGELGEVIQLDATYLQSWLLAPSLGGDPTRHVWRLDPRIAGSGALGDLASHLIDLAHHVTGPIGSVSGRLETKARRSPLPGAVDPTALAIDDLATFIAAFESGATGMFTSSRVAGGRRDYLRLEVYGSRGAVRFANDQVDRLEVCLGESNLKYCLWSDLPCPLPAGQPPSLMAAFVAGITTGQAAQPTFADGLRCQAVLDAVERSAGHGGWESVDATS